MHEGEPVVLAKEPEGHTKQLELPGMLDLPSGHDKQEVAPPEDA